VKVKITGVVKVDGIWRRPGDVVEGVKPDVAQEIVGRGAGEIIETVDKHDVELQYLRARAKELGIPKAGQMGEAKLREAIAQKEAEFAEEAQKLAELRRVASELGIEGVDEKDVETLKAEIEAANKE
jgi:hypothetical protein